MGRTRGWKGETKGYRVAFGGDDNVLKLTIMMVHISETIFNPLNYTLYMGELHAM